MDPWDHIRRAVADTRSGSAQIAARAAQGFEGLSTRRDVMRASRALLRAHPAMAAAHADLRRWSDAARAEVAGLPSGPARRAFEIMCDFVMERTS